MRSLGLLLFRAALVAALLCATPQHSRASLFGEENIPLAKLVLGQIVELERLAEAVSIAKDQQKALAELHAGVEHVVTQLDAMQEILTRAQGLQPANVRRMSDLTQMINEARSLRLRAEQVTATRIQIAEHAVTQSALQSETTYLMGQEMIATGSTLAEESRTASPGRAAQITAAANSANMLSQGVALQTLAHLTQLTALQLEFQKSHLQGERQQATVQSAYFQSQLMHMKKAKQ